MAITPDNFKRILIEHALHRAGIHSIERGHEIAVLYYCNKLELRGACTRNCNACARHLKQGVADMRKVMPDNPYAYYTQMVKNSRAAREEELQEKRRTQVATNALGDQDARDVLDILLERLPGEAS
jgi:hypothetical protein